MEILISMTARLDEIEFGYGNQFETSERSLELAFLFNKFMKKPLQPGFFVPCDEDGNVLSEPNVTCLKSEKAFCQCGEEQVSDCRELKHTYNEAKSKVIFDGFVVSENDHNVSVTNGKTSILFSIRNWVKNIDTNERISTIEELSKLGLTLTPHAKQLIFG